MKYLYPAIFTPLETGQYDVYVPDLPYCRTCGNDPVEAVEMAEDAVSMWLWDAENKKEAIPVPSKSLSHEPPQFVSFIKADTGLFRRRQDKGNIKKTLTIPAWLNAEAENAHINLSATLKDALVEKLARE